MKILCRDYATRDGQLVHVGASIVPIEEWLVTGFVKSPQELATATKIMEEYAKFIKAGTELAVVMAEHRDIRRIIDARPSNAKVIDHQQYIEQPISPNQTVHARR